VTHFDAEDRDTTFSTVFAAPYGVPNTSSGSCSSWSDKSPTDILTDVNAALTALYTPIPAMPSTICMSMPVYWQILRYPVLALMQRSRKTRRPKLFVRQLTRQYWRYVG